MHRIGVALAIAATAAGMFGVAGIAQTGDAELRTAPLTHIGMVVPHMDAAVSEYVRVMGFPSPRVNTVTVPLPDGNKTEFKLATLSMPNFFIELVEPIDHTGPYYEHLQTHGMSVQHIGVALQGEGSVDDLRGVLEQQGGRWTLGAKGGRFAYINFQPTLGATLELNRGSTGASGQTLSPPADNALPPLATLPVSHVGLAVTDAAAVATGFAKLLGIASPTVVEYKDSQYPPGTKWNSSAYLRLASWRQGATGLEVIESVGTPTPWSEFVAHHKGSSVQHIAINVGNRMDETIRDLQAKGGKWTNGKAGGAYAYLDFQDTLGLIFELNGTSKSSRSGGN